MFFAKRQRIQRHSLDSYIACAHYLLRRVHNYFFFSIWIKLKYRIKSVLMHSQSKRRSSSQKRASRKSKPAVKEVQTKSHDTSPNALTQAVDFTSDVAQEVVHALSTIASGLVYGANTAVNTVGDITNQFGEFFDLYATQVFKGAGNVVKSISDQLGSVLRVVPLVGGGMAYVVEGAGGGVYHVLVEVGALGSKVVKRTGRIVKQSTDLVVYTLTMGDGVVKDATHETSDLVKRLAKTISGDKA